jgi:methionyl-tRNA synthetase
MISNKFYITTPIYYVNDEPHIGHSYTTILADVLRKYHRLFGRKTYFLTGTDEHGQKVQTAAEAKKLPPQIHCDLMVERFLETWKYLKIDYDDFIRTTEERHKSVVIEVLQNIWDKGEIYQDEFQGWYCLPDERYFTDKDLVESVCPLCNRPVQWMSEKNYFFKMSKYQDWLIAHILKHPEFILPDFRRNEVLGFLKQPLKDLCISRPQSRLSWGIPLPFDIEYVTYVWFDALLNYYSAVKDNGQWPATVHLIGKDILTTHSVYWPIMLKSAELELPQTIFAHGWWLVDNTKMSKSLGNVVKPLDLAKIYGVEEFRYFLMREMSPGSDASFSEAGLISRINSDLANDFGNLLSRLTTLVRQNFEGKIPSANRDDGYWKKVTTEAIDNLRSALDDFRIDEVMNWALYPVKIANRYLEEQSPWRQVKQDRALAGQTLYNGLEGLRISAILLSPVMPVKSREILRRLGAENSGLKWGELRPGTEIIAEEALFPRIDKRIIETPKTETKDLEISENVITIDDFRKVDLKVAQILFAERVAGADKLLKMQINLGSERRQLVAGIAQFYQPDDLIGKKIIVVTNLLKAKIRGIESQGMLLAAIAGGTLRLLTVDGEIENGANIS